MSQPSLCLSFCSVVPHFLELVSAVGSSVFFPSNSQPNIIKLQNPRLLSYTYPKQERKGLGLSKAPPSLSHSMCHHAQLSFQGFNVTRILSLVHQPIERNILVQEAGFSLCMEVMERRGGAEGAWPFKARKQRQEGFSKVACDPHQIFNLIFCSLVF